MATQKCQNGKIVSCRIWLLSLFPNRDASNKQTCRHVLLTGDDHPPGGDVLALGRSSCHGGGGHVWKRGARENIGDVLQAPSELRLLRTTFHSCCAIASELLRIHVFLYLRTFLLPRRKRSAGGQTWWLRPARNTWVDMSYLNWYLHHTERLLLFFCLCRFSYFLTLSIFKRFFLFSCLSCWHVEFKKTWVRAPMFQIRNSSTRSLLSHKCKVQTHLNFNDHDKDKKKKKGEARALRVFACTV